MRSQRILLVISTMSAGGAERVASVMLKHWVESGQPTGLLTFTTPDQDHYPLPEGLHRRCLNISWESAHGLQSLAANLKRLRLIRQEIVTFAPDVVVSFIDRTNVLVIMALLGTRIPVIVCERIDPTTYRIHPVWSFLRKAVYRFARRVVAQTQPAAVWARRVTRASRIVVIQNPLSAVPAATPWAARRNQIVAMGRMVPQKGFDLLLQAFAASAARADGWHLVIVGDGPDRPVLERLIGSLAIEEAVKLTGIVRDPLPILNESRVFVLPSRFEGFPNALLEAMALGCACIAADCPSGPADLIRDRYNGRLVAAEDVTALQIAIDEVVQNAEDANIYAARAREVMATHSSERIMRQWDELIGKVAQEE